MLNRRGCEQQTGERLLCPKCGGDLESKGLVPRTMKTVIGVVSWKRRVLRCPHGCEIGQIAPLDAELGVHPNQRVSDELKHAACVLAVFVPFGIASLLLKTLLGVDVSHFLVVARESPKSALLLSYLISSNPGDLLRSGTLMSPASPGFPTEIL